MVDPAVVKRSCDTIRKALKADADLKQAWIDNISVRIYDDVIGHKDLRQKSVRDNLSERLLDAMFGE